MFNYKNKSVIVTGATGALGRKLCLEFTRRGAKVAMCSRSQEKLVNLLEDITKTGGRGIYKVVDIQAIEQIRDFVKYTALEFNGVDVLVNNAAIANFGSFSTLTMEDIEKEIMVNYLGPVYFMKEVLPLMLMKKEGQIINISSVCSFNPFPFLSSYSASKAALSAMTDSLQIEFYGKNIDIINVYVAKLSGGLRFMPPPGSFHAFLQQKLMRKDKENNMIKGGMSPEIAAKKIILAASRRKKNIHTHIWEGWIIFYLKAFIAPILKKLLYYSKVKEFRK